VHLTQTSFGSFESTGSRIESLCEGDGRVEIVVKLVQIFLWRGQSALWHVEEQYDIDWHEEQSLALGPLHIMQF
jgi:hypothetical protein